MGRNKFSMALRSVVGSASLLFRREQEKLEYDVSTQSHEENRKLHGDNYVRTTKYTPLTYFPKALFEQYRRVANWFFTFTALLTLTPFSPFLPFTAWAPLIFVIGVAMIKEAVEDFRRAQQDRKMNNRSIIVAKADGTLEEKVWRELVAGDVVKLLDGQEVPADILLLSSSEEGGGCWVQTANLDGETNLKPKRALKETLKYGEGTAGGIVARIACDLPNPSLYTFNGVIHFDGLTISVGPESVLLRGSSMMNTDYAYGIIIYAGHDTKIMRNSYGAPSKRSTIEKRCDTVVLGYFALMLAISIGSSIWLGLFVKNEGGELWYIQPYDSSDFNPDRSVTAAFSSFLTSISLLSYLIPISLYVSIEIVRAFQSSLFLDRDLEMYDEATGTFAKARTSNLNDDLGMVQTVLSDKTGTLTQNKMEFFKCSIAGVSYGRGLTEVERAIAAKQLDMSGSGFGGRKAKSAGKAPAGDLSDAAQAAAAAAALPEAALALEEGFNLRDERLADLAWRQQPDADHLAMFFQILAVCNTCVPKVNKGEEPSRETVKFQAESPDEMAFVVAAKRFGYFLEERHQDSVIVDVEGRGKETFQLLATLEFNSTRKRMSVIVREPSGRPMLYCKGADTVIYERLADGGKEFADVTRDHMQEYANAGLRTLCISFRELAEDELKEFMARWGQAKAALKNRTEMLEDLAEEIEHDLTLVGCTAIEDRLQEGVPNTLETLRKMGVAVWVLTGDKLETAVNIGYACSLLQESMKVFTLRNTDMTAPGTERPSGEEDVPAEYTQAMVAKFDEMTREADAAVSAGQKVALVVEGHALADALLPGVRGVFRQLTDRCRVVICCRVSPKQKAQVTTLVRKDAGQVTLAIGDGANDVAMIQAANIGVGISGVEGRQAVLASDFSIAQFRFLERLMLWHGRLNYRRMSRMIHYFFYKNIVFGGTMFLYNTRTTMSGGIIYIQWYMSVFNTVFTALPQCLVGIIDQDVDWLTTQKFPQLFKLGRDNVYFSVAERFYWFLNSFYQTIIICTFSWFSIGHVTGIRTGQDTGGQATGTSQYSSILVVLTFQLVLMIQYWTWLHHLIIWGSLLLWFVMIAIVPNSWNQAFNFPLAQQPSFYLLQLLILVAALIPDFSLRGFRRRFKPQLHHLAQDYMALENREKKIRGIPPDGALPSDSTMAGGVHVLRATTAASSAAISRTSSVARTASTANGVDRH